MGKIEIAPKVVVRTAAMRCARRGVDASPLTESSHPVAAQLVGTPMLG
jgi:hypothetical protein